MPDEGLSMSFQLHLYICFSWPMEAAAILDDGNGMRIRDRDQDQDQDLCK